MRGNPLEDAEVLRDVAVVMQAGVIAGTCRRVRKLNRERDFAMIYTTLIQ